MTGLAYCGHFRREAASPSTPTAPFLLLDLSVVSITSAVLGLVLAVLLGLTIRWVPDSDGAQYWALAFVPLGLGSALVSRGEALPALLLVLREPLLLTGYGLLLIGLRQYLRRSRPWTLAGSVVLASLVFNAFFTAVVPSDEMRLGVRTVGIFVLMTAALLALRHVSGAALRDVRLYLQVGFGSIAALALARTALYVLPLEDEMVQQLNAAASTVTTMMLLAVVTGLALLMTARMNEALARLTVRDPLTGILNRRGLEDAADTTLSFARRIGRPIALLSCDLDHFKSINDRHGHAQGDEVLKAFAQLLVEHFPAADPVARLGGEEFVVLLPGVGDEQAYAAAERLRLHVEQHPFRLADGGTLRLSVSIGVATQPLADIGWDELLRRADRALYQAKAAGRNRTVMAPAAAPASVTTAAGWRPQAGGAARSTRWCSGRHSTGA